MGWRKKNWKLKGLALSQYHVKINARYLTFLVSEVRFLLGHVTENPAIVEFVYQSRKTELGYPKKHTNNINLEYDPYQKRTQILFFTTEYTTNKPFYSKQIAN
jgi:hypothetical protein